MICEKTFGVERQIPPMKNKLAINDCRAGVAIKLALRAYRRLPSNENKISHRRVLQQLR
jgi:hypothetical protein